MEFVLFVALAGLVAVAGVWLGMLVAPRLGRLVEPPDEDARAGGTRSEEADDHPDR